MAPLRHRRPSHHPVRGVLSFHTADPPHPSALNPYVRTPHGFDDEAVDIAVVVASHTQVLLLHSLRCDEAANLRIALRRSRQIGAAAGVLMSAYRITADQAFDPPEDQQPAPQPQVPRRHRDGHPAGCPVRPPALRPLPYGQRRSRS